MRLAGDEVDRPAALCVKVRGVGLVVNIDRNQHALVLANALPDALLVGQHDLLEVAVAERLTLLVRFGQRGDPVGQLVPHRRLERGAQRVVTLVLFARSAPLAAVIHARDARHAEQQRVDQRQVPGVLQDGCNAGDIVVIHKAQKVLAAVQRPVFRAELAQQGMGDLKQVHAVHGGVQALVALVVGAGVQHAVADELVVVAVQQLADEEEVRLYRVAEGAQLADEILVQTVGHVQTQAVDVEFLHPQADAVEDVLHDRGVFQVELDQLVMAFPALVPEAVVVVRVAVERNVEPVLVRGIPLFLLYVAERPEAAADMVEHAVQHDLDAVFVQGVAHRSKVLVRAEAAVDFAEVAGVVAVAVGFKDRGKVYRVAAELCDVLRPVRNLRDAVYQHTIVDARRAAEPDRVDLIKYALISPHG